LLRVRVDARQRKRSRKQNWSCLHPSLLVRALALDTDYRRVATAATVTGKQAVVVRCL
jgi:hypothetical protein